MYSAIDNMSLRYDSVLHALGITKEGGAHPLSRMTSSESGLPFHAAQCTAVQPSSPGLFKSFLEVFFRSAAFPSLAAWWISFGMGGCDIAGRARSLTITGLRLSATTLFTVNYIHTKNLPS